MALIPILDITSISKTDTGSVTNLEDNTVYGGAEAARADVAVFLRAVKVDVGLVETALVVASYNVETADTFQVTNTTDGWQKFYMSIIPEYAGGTAYTLNQAVYYPATGLIYRNTSPSTGVVPTNNANWTAITHLQLLQAIGTASESTNVVTDILSTGLSFATRQCLDDAVISAAKEGCCDECEDEKIESKLRKLRNLAYAIDVASNRELYLQAERFAREAEGICDNCN